MKLYFGNMVTTVTTLMVLCDVQRSDAKDCSYGDRKNDTNILGVFL